MHGEASDHNGLLMSLYPVFFSCFVFRSEIKERRKRISMKIAESTVNLASSREYVSRGAKIGATSERDFNESIKRNLMSKEEEDVSLSEGYGVQQSILSLLLSRFHFEGLFGRDYRNFRGGGYRQITSYYEEHETTEFHADGIAKTADGRTIDFKVDILMSRSLIEYSNMTVPAFQDVLRDPLIINTGSAIANIRDQKFMFDIDCDGKKDLISRPGKGSGFLTLDRNKDGRINDGSELFGAKSGNGFEDLKEFDSDGNGWIDENDEVFTKLKVWYLNDNGENVLMDLKEADVGANFLGYTAADFALKGAEGVTEGIIRSTGIFLKESTGEPGTIQHVDLAAGGENVELLFEERDDLFFAEPVTVTVTADEGKKTTDNDSYASEKSRKLERKLTEEARLRRKEERRKLSREIEERMLKRKEEETERIKRRRAHMDRFRENMLFL